MAALQEKFKKQLLLEHMKLDDAQETLLTNNVDDINLSLKSLCKAIEKLQQSKDDIMQELMESDESLENIKEWGLAQKNEIKTFCAVRDDLNKKLKEISAEENENRRQRKLDELQLEEEWIKKRADMQSQIINSGAASNQQASINKTTAVKLQKYTITPFRGDYQDWLRFWNQFSVEVDGSNIAEISKFNYLLELVKGKPRDDIMGLPHSTEGYEEAKRILVETYGKDIKIHKSLIKDLEGLRSIDSIHKRHQVHEFYNKLARIVRTLGTMKKLDTAQSAVYTLMDKLGPVREIITQAEDQWEEWSLEDLVENLRKYIDRNPLQTRDEVRRRDNTTTDTRNRYDKMMMGQFKNKCIYCDSHEHTSGKCTKILDVATRREILKKRKACFNCTAIGHAVSQCRSRSCFTCGQKHHTSICQQNKSTMDEIKSSKDENPSEKGMSGTIGQFGAIHGSLNATIETEPVRIMVDTGASSSYICSDIITRLQLKPTRKEKRCIEQMYGTMNKVVEIYKITINSNVMKDFKLDVECINAEKDILTYLPKPDVQSLKTDNPRIRRLSFADETTAAKYLPVHIMLGVSDYQRIRTSEPPVLGLDTNKDPVAEFTMLGWTLFGGSTVMKPKDKQFLLHTGQEEFEKLCSLDVLGLTEPTKSEQFNHEEFKKQIHRNGDGTYETALPWKPDCIALPDNREATKARLSVTARRLERIGKLEEYDQIMQEQIQTGILEQTNDDSTNTVVHYIPHQPVVREQAQTTKLRIVYDCSAKTSQQLPSLNECLETGPALQPKLFDILLRSRFKRFLIIGDIQKAFLQIRLKKIDRDAQRIIWYNNLKDRKLVEYRFTRVIFGATSSPYILGATIEKHLQQYENEFAPTVSALRRDTYIDDIQGGGDTPEEAAKFKNEAITIMRDAGFQLHKWHSNLRQLESDENADTETTYAKTTTGNESSDTKILGIPWNKADDSLSVELVSCTNAQHTTKRKMISLINSVFDILGWVSPIMISAKLLFSEVCKLKTGWDECIPETIQRKWKSWLSTLEHCNKITLPRSLASQVQSEFVLHGFADASGVAVCAAIYVVEYKFGQPISQNLLAAKSRVAPQDTSIPRLELIAAHTLAKLQSNVNSALVEVPISSVHFWVDSTTVLYWLSNQGSYVVFVRNRVNKIKELADGMWRYVPTKENPSDIGTRGAEPKNLNDLWFHGPRWISDEEQWPVQPDIVKTKEATVEESAKSTKVLMSQNTLKETGDRESFFEHMISRYKFEKLIRITAFIKRFQQNCRGGRLNGPLKLTEIQQAEKLWVKLAQEHELLDPNLKILKDDDGISRVDGRIPGYQPILLPSKGSFSQSIVEYFHERTLHGGVQSTMTKLRERFWIPRLRSLVKKIIYSCNLCKKLRAKLLKAPSTSNLPKFRVELVEPFAATGVDFAGPLLYKTNNRETAKAYVALFTCAATRAVHLKLCQEMSAEEFKHALKEFVARRGTPKLIVTDNAKTFQTTATWLRKLESDEDLHYYLNAEQIEWRFNMSRAPWWGGFFERLVGIMKSSLSKCIGRAMLTFKELEDVLLNVECFMNNRPLVYVGEEFDRPVLTPNILLRGTPTTFLEEDLDQFDEVEAASKRYRYLKTCREGLRKRWLNEYLRALEERHKQDKDSKQKLPQVGSIVMITDNLSFKPKWNIGKIIGSISGKDGAIRGFKIKNSKGFIIERPVQAVRDLEIRRNELHHDDNGRQKESQPGELPRQRSERKAKTEAKDKIAGVCMED